MAPALPIVGNYFQSQENARVARENTDRTIAANRSLAEYQYSKDLEMWNKGNLYNSPSAQMARLKEAGLNPNMMYGSSGATQPAVNLPKYQAPRVEYNYAPNMAPAQALSMYMDMRLKSAQLDNLKEEKRSRQFQNEFNDEMVWWKKTDMRDRVGMQRIKRDWMYHNYDTQQSYLMEKLRLQNNFIDAQTDYKDKQVEWYTGDKLASYIGVGGGLLGKLGGMFKSKASPNVIKSFPNMNSSRYRWKGNYVDHFGYDN